MKSMAVFWTSRANLALASPVILSLKVAKRWRQKDLAISPSSHCHRARGPRPAKDPVGGASEVGADPRIRDEPSTALDADSKKPYNIVVYYRICMYKYTIIYIKDEFWSTRRAVMVQLVWTFQHPVTRSDIYSTRLSAYILS